MPIRSLDASKSIILAFALCVTLSGCLTAGHKEMRIKLNADGKSGSGTILFTDITSEPGDTTDVSRDDFNSLISDYYQGKKIEKDNPGMKNIHKRLFKSDGALNGEVTFDFDDITDLGFYRYNGSGPYMYYTVGEGFFTSGEYEASNGSYAGEKMPVIFWDPTQRELYFKMSLSTSQEVHKPLVGMFAQWDSFQH
jgi:hypothetical protein